MLKINHLNGFGVGGGVVTWNPADIGSGLVLSNANRTATGNGAAGTWRGARANRSVTSGKWYWEVRLDTMGAGDAFVAGVANASATLTNYLGSDANGWGYIAASGLKVNNASTAAYGAAYAAGDVIGVKLDLDAGTLEFLKNNSSQGTAYSSLSGPLFPAVSCQQSASATARFDPRDFSYAIPAGFSPLL